MKINFLLLAIITAAITSCSTSYKTGQTPDDVYYSPARLQTDEVRRDREENNTVDNTVYTSPEDREIRRRVHNRRYRRYDDRYNYPYGYNGPVYGNPKYGTTQNTSEPRKTNLGAYAPNSTVPDSATTTNPKFGKINTAGTTTNPTRTFNNGNSSSTNKGTVVGNAIRKIFSTDNSNYNYNNNSNNSNSSPSRTFDNSNNNSSSNNSNNSRSSSTSTTTTPSSSSSTSAPVRTFGKQN